MYNAITYASPILVITMAILAVLNPFGNLPQFLSMTESLNPKTRRKLFTIITYTAFIIVITFLLIGPYIMQYMFRIHIADLRIAGGAILFAMGIYHLLAPNSSNANLPTDESESEMIKHSILPMAFPMLVGPGTLSTVIVFASDYGMALTMISTVIAFIIIYLLFIVGPTIEKVTGQLVLFVISRIMKVFIVAIGVSMFLSGIGEAFNIDILY